MQDLLRSLTHAMDDNSLLIATLTPVWGRVAYMLEAEASRFDDLKSLLADIMAPVFAADVDELTLALYRLHDEMMRSYGE
jgi:hypothetical protein